MTTIVAIVFCLVPLVLFLVGALRVKGWRHRATRAVMVIAGAAFCALCLALARQLGHPAPDWMRGPVYIGIGISLWWLYVAFLNLQRAGERRRRESLEREELRQTR